VTFAVLVVHDYIWLWCSSFRVSYGLSFCSTSLFLDHIRPVAWFLRDWTLFLAISCINLIVFCVILCGLGDIEAIWSVPLIFWYSIHESMTLVSGVLSWPAFPYSLALSHLLIVQCTNGRCANKLQWRYSSYILYLIISLESSIQIDFRYTSRSQVWPLRPNNTSCKRPLSLPEPENKWRLHQRERDRVIWMCYLNCTRNKIEIKIK